MVKRNKNTKCISEKANLKSWWMFAIYIIILIGGVVGLSFTKLYEVLSDKTALAIMWTMVGFSFTVFCFIYPRIMRYIKIFDKVERMSGEEGCIKFFGKKKYMKYEESQVLSLLLKSFEFSVMLVMVIFTILSLTNLYLEIFMWVNSGLAAYVLVETFLTYIIIWQISTSDIDFVSFDEETYKELMGELNDDGKIRALFDVKTKGTNQTKNNEENRHDKESKRG